MSEQEAWQAFSDKVADVWGLYDLSNGAAQELRDLAAAAVAEARVPLVEALTRAYPIVVVAAEELSPDEIGYVCDGWAVMQEIRALLYPAAALAKGETG